MSTFDATEILRVRAAVAPRGALLVDYAIRIVDVKDGAVPGTVNLFGADGQYYLFAATDRIRIGDAPRTSAA